MPKVPDPFPTSSTRQRPELSRPLQVASLGRRDANRRPDATEEISVEASAAECTALARRLDVPAVLALRCRFRLTAADAAGRVSADGLLTATLRRVCVASLEEFDDEVVEAFNVRFVPAAALTEDEESLDPDADDDIPYEGVQIDLGEAAVEQVALAMQPYPRKPGAIPLEGVDSVDAAPTDDGAAADPDIAAGDAKPNPFAVLRGKMPS